MDVFDILIHKKLHQHSKHHVILNYQLEFHLIINMTYISNNIIIYITNVPLHK